MNKMSKYTGSRKTVPSDFASSNQFDQLRHISVSALDEELKNVLIKESEYSNRSKIYNRKLTLLERSRSEAKITELLYMLDDFEDPEETISCCIRKQRIITKRTHFISLGLDPNLDRDEMTRTEACIDKLQFITRVLIALVSIFDFVLASFDVYTMLGWKMQLEYIFLFKLYNCGYLLNISRVLLVAAHCIHGFFCIALLYTRHRDTSEMALFWMTSQILLIALLFVDAYFQTRFHSPIQRKFVSYIYWRTPVDFIQMYIVIFRFYKTYNPFTFRLHYATSNKKVDRSINTEIQLRNSPFLKSKTTARSANMFQRKAVIQKVDRLCGILARHHPRRVEIILEEIAKAREILQSPSLHPQRTMVELAKKKKPRIDFDKKTVFGRMYLTRSKKI